MTRRYRPGRGMRLVLAVGVLAIALAGMPTRGEAVPADSGRAPVPRVLAEPELVPTPPPFAGAVAAGRATAGTAPVVEAVAAGPMRAEERDAAETLVALVNAERQAHGLSPLQEVPGLAAAAYLRALEVDERLSHERPAGSLGDLLSQAGIDWQRGAENLAYLDATAPAASAAQTVHQLLMDSPNHRRNLLAPDLRYLGIGAHQRDGRWFFVELFAG
ncbi:MAG TPA: CAP domain-containing protein [Chloroflexota bacterium]|nr:CAP domain-containing protein [Chloroflexota bacterium]